MRHFEADGNATIVNLGFVPDWCELRLDEGTNPDVITWFRRMVDDESIYGHLNTGSSGVVTRLTTAATGINTYDTVTPRILLPAPDGEGYAVSALPNSWTQARSTAATARSTTALGTVIKPTTGNETGYVYECTTAGTGGVTEPTWPTNKGDSVTDGTTVWIARDWISKNVGVKGIEIGASASQNTDGNQLYLVATRGDRDPADTDAGGVVAGQAV
jgi:hypothetical protein